METLTDGHGAVADRVQFTIDMGDGHGMHGEGFLVFVEVRSPDAWAYVAVLGLPQLAIMPLTACRVVERGALLRRVLAPMA